MWVGLVALFALMSSAPSSEFAGFAQDQDPTILPEVVVEGRSADAQARNFIAEIAAPSKGAALARWKSSICIGAANLGTEAGQFLVDRVAATAEAVGLRPGQPGCIPDVLIVATSNGDEAAQGLIDRFGPALYPGGSGFSRSRAALLRFASSNLPVRWWHVSQPTDPRTEGRAVRLPGPDGWLLSENPEEELLNLPQVTVLPTLLKTATRQDLRRVYIILDFEQIDTISFDQLADYIAFIALAQVDPDADTVAFSTILNVFDDPASTPGLTDWDRAYLTGLYESDDTGVHAGARAAALRRDMVGVVRDGAARTGD